MELFGDINVKAPGLKKQEFCIDQKETVEFEIKMDTAQKEKITFGINVWMDKSAISITTEVTEDDDNSPHGDFYFTMKELKGDSLTIQLNISQATAIKEVLEHYINAYYSYRALATERVVKAA